MILEDFKDRTGKWVTQIHHNKKTIWTRSGSTWNNMRRRCIPNGKTQVRNPTYVGCEMSDNFKDFQWFTNWSIDQIGYNLLNYNLDKDFLKPHNKTYCEQNCVFIPKRLNGFLCGVKREDGELPPGVYYEQDRQTYQLKLNTFEGHMHLGRYTTIEGSLKAYRQAKEAEAKNWADLIVKENIFVDNRIIECLYNWKCENYE